MDQVEFLGLAHTFATVSPIATFYAKPNQKGTNTQAEIQKFTVVREVHNLISPLLRNRPGNSTSFTRLFLPRRRRLGTRLVPSLVVVRTKHTTPNPPSMKEH